MKKTTLSTKITMAIGAGLLAGTAAAQMGTVVNVKTMWTPQGGANASTFLTLSDQPTNEIKIVDQLLSPALPVIQAAGVQLDIVDTSNGTASVANVLVTNPNKVKIILWRVSPGVTFVAMGNSSGGLITAPAQSVVAATAFTENKAITLTKSDAAPVWDQNGNFLGLLDDVVIAIDSAQ